MKLQTTLLLILILNASYLEYTSSAAKDFLGDDDPGRNLQYGSNYSSGSGSYGSGSPSYGSSSPSYGSGSGNYSSGSGNYSSGSGSPSYGSSSGNYSSGSGSYGSGSGGYNSGNNNNGSYGAYAIGAYTQGNMISVSSYSSASASSSTPTSMYATYDFSSPQNYTALSSAMNMGYNLVISQGTQGGYLPSNNSYQVSNIYNVNAAKSNMNNQAYNMDVQIQNYDGSTANCSYSETYNPDQNSWMMLSCSYKYMDSDQSVNEVKWDAQSDSYSVNTTYPPSMNKPNSYQTMNTDEYLSHGGYSKVPNYQNDQNSQDIQDMIDKGCQYVANQGIMQGLMPNATYSVKKVNSVYHQKDKNHPNMDMYRYDVNMGDNMGYNKKPHCNYAMSYDQNTGDMKVMSYGYYST